MPRNAPIYDSKRPGVKVFLRARATVNIGYYLCSYYTVFIGLGCGLLTSQSLGRQNMNTHDCGFAGNITAPVLDESDVGN